MILTSDEIYEIGLRKLETMYQKDPDLLDSDEAEQIRDELDMVWDHLDVDVRKQIEQRVRCPIGCINVEGEQVA